LVRCPEVFEGGRVVDKLVQNIDIAPTILELAGISKPEHMNGLSFIPLLKGNIEGWRDKIFYEYFWEYDYPMTPTMFGIRTDSTKYIMYYGIWDQNEFFNIKDDPNEMYNLIAKEDLQPQIKQHMIELYDWLEETGGMKIPLKETIKHKGTDYKHYGQY